MKTFNQHLLLNESGDRPYKWRRSKSTRSEWLASFVTDNKNKYTFRAFTQYVSLRAREKKNTIPKRWEVGFELSGGRDDAMGVSGTEGTSAIRVFGTVAQMFEAFVKEVNPMYMMFIADKTGGTGRGARSKLYSRFAKSFAKKHGYNLEEKEHDNVEVHFLFTSKGMKK